MTNAVGAIARTEAGETQPPFHDVAARDVQRLRVAGDAEHLHVPTITDRERIGGQRVQRGRPALADEPFGVARSRAHLDHDGFVRRTPEAEQALGRNASVVAEQHQRARRLELAGDGASGGRERGRRLGRGLRGHGPRRDRTRDGDERERGRERASHGPYCIERNAEPGPSPGCGGCGAPLAPRARSGSVRVRRATGSGPVDHTDVSLETVGRRVERVRRPSERRGHRP